MGLVDLSPDKAVKEKAIMTVCIRRSVLHNIFLVFPHHYSLHCSPSLLVSSDRWPGGEHRDIVKEFER